MLTGCLCQLIKSYGSHPWNLEGSLFNACGNTGAVQYQSLRNVFFFLKGWQKLCRKFIRRIKVKKQTNTTWPSGHPLTTHSIQPFELPRGAQTEKKL
jgi:hypothetical protein